jgi:hypothetical protein
MRGRRSIHGALRGSDKHREASSLEDQGKLLPAAETRADQAEDLQQSRRGVVDQLWPAYEKAARDAGMASEAAGTELVLAGSSPKGADDDHRICQKRQREARASATAGWLPGFAGRTVAGQEARLSSGRWSAGGSPSARVDEQVERSADCRRQAVGRVASQSTSVRARLRCRLNQQLGSCSNAGRTG